MDQELETLIKERYQILPSDMKKALASLPIQDIVQTIAIGNGLHLDQAGDLYTETLLILLGVEKVGDYAGNLEKHLRVDLPTANKIAQTVNDQIFVSIRESLRQIQEVQDTAPEEDAGEKSPESRDSILSEIENPTPTIHPISAADQTIPGPAIPREITSDFVGAKLSETASIPSQKADMKAPQTTTETAPAPEKPKSYSVDPYREPLA